MTRLGALFWFVLVLAAGFTTFKVKYAVQDIADQLNRVRTQTIAEQQEIRVLTAEWTYLNQPERLAELNQRFLGLAPPAARQLQGSIADIALRPPPPAPDVMVEASPEAAASPIPAGLAVTPAVVNPAAANSAARVQLAKAGPNAASNAAPGSLDALIAQIAEAR
jgi:cell division protein FtsL